jgi:hypothetical protein
MEKSSFSPAPTLSSSFVAFRIILHQRSENVVEVAILSAGRFQHRRFGAEF